MMTGCTILVTIRVRMPWQIGGFTRGNLEHSNILSYMPDGNGLRGIENARVIQSSALMLKPIMSIDCYKGRLRGITIATFIDNDLEEVLS